MEPSDDVELMLRVRDGQDAGAFEELMRRYQRPLTGFLARLTGNLDSAQDLAEETFVRVWQSAPRYRPSGKFTTWLFTIASRLATDHARRAHVRRAVPLDAPMADDGRTLAERLADAGPAADQQVSREQDAALVRAAVQALPLEQRTALALCEFQDFSYAEAAEAMGCSVKSVELRIYRAKQALREKLRRLL
ncbi:MAG: sigma-70 family RNA polymerase sigma factor [Verrucomicrobia bacterium]|nr:sigma-70 family RNA polymerase sigma factor [Verrucomicrobiota bacterium]